MLRFINKVTKPTHDARVCFGSKKDCIWQTFENGSLNYKVWSSLKSYPDKDQAKMTTNIRLSNYAEFQLLFKSWKKYDLIKLPNRSLKSEPYKFWNRSTWLDTRQRGPMTITDGDGVQEEIEGLSPDSLKNRVVEFFKKASHQK